MEPVNSWPNFDEAKVSRSGPCGFNERSGNDYNFPGSDWGKKVEKTYKAGDTIDVQWCVDNNGEHGGAFIWRLCDDEAIVKKFIDTDYEPTEAEKQEAENCFQKGVLECVGDNCKPSPDCDGSGTCDTNKWFGCNAYEDTGCHGLDNAELNSCETTISGGYTVSGQVKLPGNFTSDHTLLSWKWNSFETPQVYLGCADISIE